MFTSPNDGNQAEGSLIKDQSGVRARCDGVLQDGARKEKDGRRLATCAKQCCAREFAVRGVNTLTGRRGDEDGAAAKLINSVN